MIFYESVFKNFVEYNGDTNYGSGLCFFLCVRTRPPCILAIDYGWLCDFLDNCHLPGMEDGSHLV